MDLQNILSADWTRQAGSLLVIEALPGTARQQVLGRLRSEAAAAGARTWFLDLDFEDGGPWAGISEIFRDLLAEVGQSDPDLVVRHDYELVHVVPELQRNMRVRNPSLTDLAPPDEKVRNYPADRAYRIIHGLINFLDSWQSSSGARVVLVCDHFDKSSHIGLRFFRELVRRRGNRLGLVLVAATQLGGSRGVREAFGAQRIAQVVSIDLLQSENPVDRQKFAQAAAELDSSVGEDRLHIQIHISSVLRYARLGQARDLLFKWNCLALELYNTLGLYEDALVYGESARAVLKGKDGPGIETTRWALFLKMIMCHLGLGNAEAAFRLAEEEALGRSLRPEWRGQLCYLMAMLHARYLPIRDLQQAEEYLDEGVRLLEAVEQKDDRINFQYAFNRNGLAMIRHFQGRYQDAIELCHACQRHLDAHLSKDRHRLHRSILFYNQAQVYVALGEKEKAVDLYSLAMEMDPNYSEYYNERGSVFLKMGRFEEALVDYRKAIELSPPYYESFTNLGQCLRRLGREHEAVVAYSTALDLTPDQFLALVGRAQSLEALGEWDAAIVDYDAALALDTEQWEIVANRGVLHYQLGHIAKSLSDLDGAIELAPGEAALYQNRAIALEALGRRKEAARDLRKYLEAEPFANDRREVLARLEELETTPAQLNLSASTPAPSTPPPGA